MLKKETGNTVAGVQGLQPRSLQIASIVHGQTAAGVEQAVVGGRPGALGLEQGAESPVTAAAETGMGVQQRFGVALLGLLEGIAVVERRRFAPGHDPEAQFNLTVRAKV